MKSLCIVAVLAAAAIPSVLLASEYTPPTHCRAETDPGFYYTSKCYRVMCSPNRRDECGHRNNPNGRETNGGLRRNTTTRNVERQREILDETAKKIVDKVAERSGSPMGSDIYEAINGQRGNFELAAKALRYAQDPRGPSPISDKDIECAKREALIGPISLAWPLDLITDDLMEESGCR